MDKLLEQLIADFQERDLPELTPRQAFLPAIPGKVDVVIGMRRSGKSWRLYQAIKDLLDRGVPKERVLYINFDDERLLPMQVADLHHITETYYRLFPDNKGVTCHFFFDEIQNVEGWEHFVRRVLDTEDVRLTLTGSSAKLLSREIATALRGRSLATELFPFSFAEFLAHQGADSVLRKPVGSGRRALLVNRLREYLTWGGFPEVQGLERPYWVRVLQEYVDVVILRDIVERYNVGNIQPLRYLIRHLLGSPSTLFSVNKFYNDLKSQGIPCGKNTLHEYLAYLEDAFLVFPVPIHAQSLRTQQVNPRKVYAVDTGLALAFRPVPGQDRGRLLENMVYLDLRRRGQRAVYCRTKSGYEVDFMADPGPEQDKPELVQVAESLRDASTRVREIRALEQAMTEHGITTGTLVTLDEEEVVTTPAGMVQVVPAWQWLLR